VFVDVVGQTSIVSVVVGEVEMGIWVPEMGGLGAGRQTSRECSSNTEYAEAAE
jgi:hypothetical protein